eukprot:TRINITY_DN2116_c0_g1_i1.p1 TRINITY_DN2116_c0_g1~~TRINITY_DN2116_c0_g1_i1.p1  ORF type:complete len:449 (+),score=61.46 TRINITY_DN2116_c0_g1_i1:53-1399(+)
MRVYFVLVILCTAVLSSCVRADLQDKFDGVILMGAYGDALGAPTEGVGLGDRIVNWRSCALKDAKVWYNSTAQEKNCWGVWPPTTVVDSGGPNPVPTDDTCYKMYLLEPFLQLMLQEGTVTADFESQFKQYLVKQSYAEYNQTATWPNDWLLWNTRAMTADWLVMMDAAQIAPVATSRPHGNNTFYNSNQSVCFGLYLYLVTAASWYQSSPYEVYTVYSNITQFDYSYGKQITGLTGALLANAVNKTTTPDSFVDWFRNTTDMYLTDWSAKARNDEEAANLLNITTYLGRVDAAVENLRAVSYGNETAALHGYWEFVNNASLSPQTPMKLQDPMVMFGLIRFALGVSNNATSPDGGLMESFRLITAAPADDDTVASFMGLLVGGYFGADTLIASSTFECSEQEDPAITLGTQLGQLDLVLQNIYGYRYQDGGKLLMQLASVASPAFAM